MSLQDLPLEIILQVCSYLDSGTCASTETCAEDDLRQFGAVCKRFHELVQPTIWRSLHIVLGKDNLHSLLAALGRLCSPYRVIHPALRYTVKLQVMLSGLTYADAETAVLVKRTDRLLAGLLRNMRALEHLEVDFSMAQHPFPNLLEYLFSSKLEKDGISTLVATGLYNQPELRLSTSNHYLRRLRVGYTGCGLSIDLTALPALTDLYLELDCRITHEHPSHFVAFPASIWTRLKSLCLEPSGWNPTSEHVVATLEDSLQAAPIVSLESVGLFTSDQDLTRTFGVLSKYAPHLRRLAFTTPDFITSALLDSLGDQLPHLEELTCCAFQLVGSWKWPSSSTQYAASFSRLPNLRTLAVNHYATYDEINGDGTPYSPVKYTMECSEEGLRDRLEFAQSMATRCKSLRNILFCPTEQECSYVQVGRNAELNLTVRAEGPMLFWQGFS